MQNGPDPASLEMGQLVDQWLVSLRESRLSGRQLERVARALAKASKHGTGNTTGEQKILVAFRLWLAGREHRPRPED